MPVVVFETALVAVPVAWVVSSLAWSGVTTLVSCAASVGSVKCNCQCPWGHPKMLHGVSEGFALLRAFEYPCYLFAQRSQCLSRSVSLGKLGDWRDQVLHAVQSVSLRFSSLADPISTPNLLYAFCVQFHFVLS